MDASTFIPWYNRPAREFPAKRWLYQRYGFVVSSAVWARPADHPPARREFPAKRWAQQHGLCYP